MNGLSLGLIGHPVEHSISPIMHTAAMQALDLHGEYRLYAVSPSNNATNQLSKLLKRVRNSEIHGLNVTIPYKMTVIPMMDELSKEADSIGAVNTIYSQSGRLIGENTDARGFSTDLRASAHSHLSKSSADNGNLKFGTGLNALVLGAGGSARAVIYSLLDSGWFVNIATRRIEQAKELAVTMKRFSLDNTINGMRLNSTEIINLDDKIDLVVNTTPVGMMPDVNGCPWPVDMPLPNYAFVYDLIYNPPQTKLLRKAKTEGRGCANGLGMLVEQAALSFEYWTGQSPPRDAMRKSVSQFNMDNYEPDS